MKVLPISKVARNSVFEKFHSNSERNFDLTKPKSSLLAGEIIDQLGTLITKVSSASTSLKRTITKLLPNDLCPATNLVAKFSNSILSVNCNVCPTWEPLANPHLALVNFSDAKFGEVNLSNRRTFQLAILSLFFCLLTSHLLLNRKKIQHSFQVLAKLFSTMPYTHKARPQKYSQGYMEGMKSELSLINKLICERLLKCTPKHGPTLDTWSEYFLKAERSITGKTSLAEYRFIVSKLMRSMHDPHFQTVFIDWGICELPIDCYSLDNRLYVYERDSKLGALQLHDEIVKIQGIAAQDFLKLHFGDFSGTSATPFFTRREVSKLFRSVKWFQNDITPEMECRLDCINHLTGETYTVTPKWQISHATLESLSLESKFKFDHIKPAIKSSDPTKIPNCQNITTFTFELGKSCTLGYLHLGSWFNSCENMINPNQIWNVLNEFETNTQGVVLDLRGNSGGLAINAIGLFCCFIKNITSLNVKHNFLSKYSLKDYLKDLIFVYALRRDVNRVENPTDVHVIEAKNFYKNYFKKKGVWASLKAMQIKGSFNFEELPPNHRCHFSKPVFILIDDTSYSAAQIFAALMQDHTRAVIIGTPSLGGGWGILPSDVHCGSFLLAGMVIPSNCISRNSQKYPLEFAIQPHVHLSYTKRDYMTDGADYQSSLKEILRNHMRVSA